MQQKKSAFLLGLRHGLPIGLGYFAVSFSLGIAAKHAGLTPFQGFFASLMLNASAGEYAGFRLIADNATYIEAAIMIFIANARYFLMSCALSQKLSPTTPFFHRFIIGFDITDELFGISIAQNGYLNPFYFYGAMTSSIPFWATGTMLGIIAGNLLPLRIVSALSVALYGMFLAVIIPESKKNKTVLLVVVISFAVSYLFSILPVVKEIAEGTRIIILTVLISAIAAIVRPVESEVASDER
jgi:predicted branched-subunit amino acid permease